MEKTGKLLQWLWLVITPFNWALQHAPEVLVWVPIWTLSRPFHSMDPIVTILIHVWPRNMTDGVVILKVTYVQIVKLPQSTKHIVIQNIAVGVGVTLTMKLDQGFLKKLGKASTSTEHKCGQNMHSDRSRYPGRRQNHNLSFQW